MAASGKYFQNKKLPKRKKFTPSDLVLKVPYIYIKVVKYLRRLQSNNDIEPLIAFVVLALIPFAPGGQGKQFVFPGSVL